MTLEDFLSQLKNIPNTVTFNDTMAVIEAYYDYTPARFNNGNVTNEAGTNEGSCKLFAFASLKKLTQEQTLNCFGDYYRKDVLENPEGNDHANIRNFMQTSWEGVVFDNMPLTLR